MSVLITLKMRTALDATCDLRINYSCSLFPERADFLGDILGNNRNLIESNVVIPTQSYQTITFFIRTIHKGDVRKGFSKTYKIINNGKTPTSGRTLNMIFSCSRGATEEVGPDFKSVNVIDTTTNAFPLWLQS